MWIVPEREIAGLMTREAAFDAVEKVFAAMASGDAYNFPVVREAIGHEDALYGFKGGFDRAGLVLGLKAGGYWPNNLEKRGEINHQSSVFLFDPDTGKAKAGSGKTVADDRRERSALPTASSDEFQVKIFFTLVRYFGLPNSSNKVTHLHHAAVRREVGESSSAVRPLTSFSGWASCGLHFLGSRPRPSPT